MVSATEMLRLCRQFVMQMELPKRWQNMTLKDLKIIAIKRKEQYPKAMVKKRDKQKQAYKFDEEEMMSAFKEEIWEKAEGYLLFIQYYIENVRDGESDDWE